MPALDYYHETVRHALTKDGWIITELVTEGVNKEQIVLCFYSTALREAGEFAVQ